MGKHNHAMQLGGHRGMGENLCQVAPDGSIGVYPAYHENTLHAFKQAAKCGVGFVEFDVQVTRDGVPVLWHDDHVVCGSEEEPKQYLVQDLTLAELEVLSGRFTAHPTLSESTASASDTESMEGGSPTAASAGNPSKLLRLFRDRTTRQFRVRYQRWLCDEDDAIPTLEAAFNAVPEHIGFDIEIKMAVGDDVERTPREEVDRMLDAILPVVERCSANSPRTIFFSCFDPDVCLELTKRQSRHPVYYLSGCGKYIHVDGRRTSLDTAIAFARAAGMRGIVVPASVVMENKATFGSLAGGEGLEVMTYGLENNDLANLKAQADLCVRAAIVDEVAGVTESLASQGAQAAAAL